MKQRKCKRGRLGFCYSYGNCEDCEINEIIVGYEKKLKSKRKLIDKLCKDISNLDAALLFYSKKVKIQGAEEFARRLKEKFDKRIVWHYDGTYEGPRELNVEIDDALEEYKK